MGCAAPTSLSRAVRFPLRWTKLRSLAPTFLRPARSPRPALPSPALPRPLARHRLQVRKKARRAPAPRLARRRDLCPPLAPPLSRLRRVQWLANAGDPARQAVSLLE